MSSIDEKFGKFERSCLDMARLEAYELKVNMNKKIQERIEDEVNQYKKDADNKYVNKLNKMEKKFNSDIYVAELDYKKTILSNKYIILQDIKKEVQNKLKIFVNSNEYLEYLEKNIISVMENLQGDSYEIYITENDYNKYKDIITQKYNCTLKIAENEIIGGCLAIDKLNNVAIDNSIRNCLEESWQNKVDQIEVI